MSNSKRVQTRRSVSIPGATYWALRAKCDQDGTSMGGVVGKLVLDYLEGAAEKKRKPKVPDPVVAPVPKPVLVSPPEPDKQDEPESTEATKGTDELDNIKLASQIFTF